MLQSIFSRRWVATWRRHLLVWRKQFWGSLATHIAEPLIVLIAFGYGLGSLVGHVDTPQGPIPYLAFIASGLIAVSTMNSASFEALYSAFSRLDHQKTWHGMLDAALVIDDIVLGEIMWAAFKGVFAILVILSVMLVLLALGGYTLRWHMVLVVPLLALVALAFSCMGMIATALAKGYEFFSFYITLFLTPMTFLSGAFFPRDKLPEWLRIATEYLPLTAAIQLVRPLFFGVWPDHFVLNVFVLMTLTVAAFYLALHLLRQRFA